MTPSCELTLPIEDADFDHGLSNHPSLERSSMLMPVSDTVEVYTRIHPVDPFLPASYLLAEPYKSASPKTKGRVDPLSINSIELIHLFLIKFLSFIPTILLLFSIAVLG